MSFGLTAMQIAVIAAVTAVASAGIGAYSAYQQGEAAEAAAKGQQDQLNRQAEQEEVAAKEREIDRRKRLLSAMASQNAASAASGIRAYEGSALNMLKTDVNSYEYDSIMDKGSTSSTINALKSQGQWAMYGGNVAKRTSLFKVGGKVLSGVSSVASLGGPTGAKTSSPSVRSTNSPSYNQVFGKT
jgi:hypothetical protein